MEVLPDMHTALKRFWADFNLNTNFCHSYIIRHFSDHSFLGIWAASLLKTRTYEEYIKEKQRIQSILSEFIAKLTEIALILPEFLKKLTI